MTLCLRRPGKTEQSRLWSRLESQIFYEMSVSSCNGTGSLLMAHFNTNLLPQHSSINHKVVSQTSRMRISHASLWDISFKRSVCRRAHLVHIKIRNTCQLLLQNTNHKVSAYTVYFAILFGVGLEVGEGTGLHEPCATQWLVPRCTCFLWNLLQAFHIQGPWKYFCHSWSVIPM